MDANRRTLWSVALGMSLIALVCSGIALYSMGVIMDENNLDSWPAPALWVVAIVGVVGLLISLPGWFATKQTKKAS
ncbi:hypothetical protein ACTXM3_16720 [Glutamicibacter arilaitensis]|nr:MULTISPECIES: hypothetical protein [Glutamicibacter]CBT74480.1 hypothetical membrane protein [Glutamicibacter arilaitensis Re117]